MISLSKYGIPLPGARVNWGGPFTRDLCFLTIANARAGLRLYDMGPSASHGIMTAMDAATDWEAGKFGGSLNFDGATTQEITFPSTANISDVGNDPGTTGNTNSPGGTWMFVGRRNALDDGPFFYKSDNDGTRGFACWISAANGIHFYCPLSGGGIGAISSNFPIDREDFVLHVTWTGVYSGSAIRLFLNGVECTYTSRSGSGSAHNSDIGYDLRIGDGGSPGPSKWNGKFYGMGMWRRCLSDVEIRDLGIWPWLMVAPQKIPIVTAGGGGGTLATTNANDTSAASGTSTVTGSLAKTNSNDTSAASGNVSISGSLAKTNADDTAAASGAGTVTGTSSTTNAADTTAASGSPVVSGSLATTNANDSVSASGSVGGSVTGTLATTNANDTSAAAGTSTVNGSTAKLNAADTSAAAGNVLIFGTLVTTNTNDSISASGTVGDAVTGTLTKTNANDTSAASGSPTVSGSLAKSNAADTSAASGTLGVTGSANITNAADSCSAAGTVSLVGLLAVMNANDLATALGLITVSGAVNYTNANDVMSSGSDTPENVDLITPFTTNLNIGGTITTNLNLNTVIKE